MSSDKRLQILDVEQLSLLVEKKDKARFLFYIKKIFNDLVNCGEMNVRSLYLIKQEIMQTVYSYLKQNGVLATKLFQDDLSVRLSDNATISMIDMTRWINYLLEQTYTFVEEAQQSMTIVDKINYFIEQHYPENIDRNLLAEVFFLTPEYLAKLYKKKSGLALNDYINYYRIEKAKELLLSNELKISEISERVGFNSFSYFSTMFKKYTGQSPKQYKAQ
jgi:two-component system response regulator YesN